MGARKKPAIATTQDSGLFWILAAVLAFSIGGPLIVGAVLRLIL
jgi:hypothetical protein